MHSKTGFSPLKMPSEAKLYDKIFFSAAFILAFFLMSHPDLWETANHSYIFLESLFSGRVMDFYSIVAEHNNTLYYINTANYNIFVYIIFGLWELPIFIINKLFNLAVSEPLLIYWAKLVSCGFFIGCGIMVKRLAEMLGMNKKTAFACAAFFIFNPIVFFSPVIMGQYDTLCLFFTLWAMTKYLKGSYTRFSFIAGIGVVCKFFPLLIFIPLVLLAEKRILHIIKYLVLSLWLYIPTTLLFYGRTGNSAAFTKAMMERMFAITFDTGAGAVSVYIALLSIICFLCFLYTPKTVQGKNYSAIYLSMAVMGFLFMYIYWHPQWLILLIPFVVLTTFMQKNKAPWFLLDIVMSVGFFIRCYFAFPNQIGAGLLDGGIISHIFGARVAFAPAWQTMDNFIGLIPYITVIAPVMLVGAIVINIIFKFPVGEKSLADRLSTAEVYDGIPTKVYLYIIFIVGIFGCVFMPALLEWLNAFAII